MPTHSYIGRFAPSPTGSLHFGSLVAAVASYCDAKKQGGKWLLRIEDLDKPREVKGATQQIIETLAGFGFKWDDEIIYQSERNDFYEAALKNLEQRALVYPCTCSRKEIADSAQSVGIEGAIYPKTCLHQPLKNQKNAALRIKSPEKIFNFNDLIQGYIAQNIANEIGDFILRRSDLIFAYQLAVVVDDAAQNITHVVRGADLLLSTPRQLYLQQQLGFSHPQYAHIPIVRNAHGEKLSKQTLAKAIEVSDAKALLYAALEFLNQSPPKKLQTASIQTIWDWAIAHWDLPAIKKSLSTSA